MRDSFIFYRSFSDAVKKMNVSEKAQFLDILCDYALDNKNDHVDIRPMVDIAFGLIRPLIDKNNARFENGKKGGRPKPNNNQTITKHKPTSNLTPSNDVSVDVSVNDNDIKEKEIDKSISKKKAFRIPTVEEVREYCNERDNTVPPEQFHAFYESKGWMVGNAHMKDWQAAVRTWEKNYPKRREFAL